MMVPHIDCTKYLSTKGFFVHLEGLSRQKADGCVTLAPVRRGWPCSSLTAGIKKAVEVKSLKDLGADVTSEFFGYALAEV